MGIAFIFLAFFVSACSTTPKTWNQELPPKEQKSDIERNRIYDKYQILGWSGTSTNFELGTEQQQGTYTLESLRPSIESVVPSLKQDLDEIESYHDAGNLAIYTSLGCFALAAGGFAAENSDVYHGAQSAGLLSLFAWVILEQFEWQVKDQVRYQYNEALREQLKLTNTEIDFSAKKRSSPGRIDLLLFNQTF